jgi:hypothetical protein
MVFGLKRKQEENNPLLESLTNNIGSTANNSVPATEADRIKEMGVDNYLLLDNDLMRLVEGWCVRHISRVFIGPDGNPVFGPDNKIVLIPSEEPVPWAIELRIFLSNLIAGRTIKHREVEIYKLWVRCRFAEIIDMMPPQDLRNYGGAVEDIEMIVSTSFDDAEDGQKGRLLKVQERHFKVAMDKPGK